jgi:hypothetical protein
MQYPLGCLPFGFRRHDELGMFNQILPFHLTCLYSLLTLLVVEHTARPNTEGPSGRT